MTRSAIAHDPIVLSALRRHFSSALAARARELLAMGVPLGCFARATKIMQALGATKDTDHEWSFYTGAFEGRTENSLELWHEKTGTLIEIAVLGTE